jgi:hypothetical protein
VYNRQHQHANKDEDILLEKPGNGGVTIKEILPVRFSKLEGAEAA